MNTKAAGQVTRRFSPLEHTRVTIDDTFWAVRQQVNRERTLFHIHEQNKSTGRIDALNGIWDKDVVRGGPKACIPILFWDSDVAKWLEAASYSLATHADVALEKIVDEVIDAVAYAQQPNGYLNSWFAFVEPQKCWTNLRDWHELYNAGHLIEAAVAHFQATGKRRLLDVVCRYADYIDTVFGAAPEKRQGYCGHPEIELALIRLAHVTGEQRYMDMARYFVNERGREPHYFTQEAIERGEDPKTFWARSYEYNQSHKQVRDQEEVVGHAVRATYLYSAMADLAAEDGDASLLKACQILWKHLTTKRMYVMGGIGSSRHNEGFTSDYDLPNESAYAETCAAIALVFWAQRMLQIDLDRRYADIMELALYNAILSGVSLEGSTFFYDNPLASNGGHHRTEWFVCPCCPPNLARIIASLGGYVYLHNDSEIVVNLYVQSKAEFQLADHIVTLRQETNYPWDGAVQIQVGVNAPMSFGLRLRLPEWCQAASLSVNGETLDLGSNVEAGYVLVERSWQNGDVIALNLPMQVERLYAHPAVRADVGSTTLRRGPIVYCLEQTDQRVPLQRVVLPAQSAITARFDAELLGGVTVLEGQGLVLGDAGWEDKLYSTAAPETSACDIRAIPYYTWDNREAGEMRVWLPELL